MIIDPTRLCWPSISEFKNENFNWPKFFLAIQPLLPKTTEGQHLIVIYYSPTQTSSYPHKVIKSFMHLFCDSSQKLHNILKIEIIKPPAWHWLNFLRQGIFVRCLGMPESLRNKGALKYPEIIFQPLPDPLPPPVITCDHLTDPLPPCRTIAGYFNSP